MSTHRYNVTIEMISLFYAFLKDKELGLETMKKADIICHFDEASGVLRWSLKSHPQIPALCVEGKQTNKPESVLQWTSAPFD